jgi:hypothetical protein
MVINFRARGISWGARKLAWTLTLNLKKKKIEERGDTRRGSDIADNIWHDGDNIIHGNKIHLKMWRTREKQESSFPIWMI